MGLTVEVDPKALYERSTDDRGRFTLGSEYANQDVKLLVIENSDD